MGWDGMGFGFTLRKGWDGTLGKGRKRRRKRNNRTDGKRPNAPNRETGEWQCIREVFLRFECAEFYLCGGRVERVSLSWDLIWIYSALIDRYSLPFPIGKRGESVRVNRSALTRKVKAVEPVFQREPPIK